ncbi:antitoxin VapB family protein [Candidatus Micrarchaeota archaeon]|nr:antitoxin VapB family protein [Candidatus Micrarchaeota archaeon]
MAVKTITITEEAYNTLKAKRQPEESFTKVILRITKRRPLSDFWGILSKESGEALEREIMESRRRHMELHQARVERISKELSR